MREIKFRAWDESTKTMHTMDRNTRYENTLRAWQILERFSCVQQWIGLNDRLNVDIYEGDVLEYTSSTKQMISPPYTEIVDPSWEIYIIDDMSTEQTVTLVKQHNSYFSPLPSQRQFNKYMLPNSVIIGNIYQNDEYRKLMK